MTNRTTTPRPRRARLLALLVGALAVVAIVPAGASATAKVVQEDAWMQYQPPTSGVTPFLFGGLGHSSKVCRHDREIDIAKSPNLMDFDYVWHTELSSDGGTTVNLANGDRGNYYVLTVLPKKVVKLNGQKVKCSGATLNEAVYAN